MGIERLREFLRRHPSIGFDTSVLIYQIEENDRYVTLTDVIFQWLERRESRAVTSTLTMTEVLVQPYREPNEARVEQYLGLLLTLPRLDWIAPNLEIASMAARLRASYKLRTPDAIQAATALQAGVSGFITNDSVFQRMDGFHTLVLEKVL